MIENTKAPEIRFDGFDEEWEQRKLGDVAEFSKGYGYSKGDLTDDGTPIILYGRLYTKYETEIKNIDTFAETKDRSVISRGGEVIVPSSGETAEDISRASVVCERGVILGGDLNIVKADSTIIPCFLAISLSNGNQQKELSKRAQGKSVVHIGNSDLKNVVLSLPSPAEQTAIGNFFRTLDDAIALKKQQHEKTVNIKKAMLGKMFPKNGAYVPEIRFEGFTRAWKQTPLGDIAEFNPKTLLPNTFRYVDLESVVGTSLVSFRTVNKDTAPSRAQRLALRGDIFFQMVRPYQRNNLLYELPFDDFVFSTGYAQLRPSIDSYFLLSRLQEDRFVAEVLDYCTGTSYPAITPTNLAAIKIFISTDPKEQTAIGNLFRNLDDLINLSQQEIEKLQNIKKACLNKMFV